ncbi:MAG: O-antigen ligase family protein [Coraliomargarita sp.]
MAGPSIAPREWAVVVAGGATLGWTAWAFAGVQQWTLHSMLVGAALTFLLSIVPLPKRFNGSDGEHGNAKNIKRLLTFPFFWFSSMLLLYIVIQGLNPSWRALEMNPLWIAEEVQPPVAWLPTGVQSDYEPMNAFRVLSSFSAAFMLCWGLWVGIRRRQSAVAVLWILAVSGTLMGMVAILQKLSDANGLLWMVKSSNQSFWGSFFYRNQAAAYLVQVMVASAVLFFYHYNQSERRAQAGGPYLLLGIFIALTAASLGLALSRGGILFGSLFLGVFVVAAIGRFLLSVSLQRSLIISGLVVMILAGGGYAASRMINVEDIQRRFGDIGETIATADQDSRAICTKITWRMAQEELLFGWGAGSWRYIFPMYQKSYPEIYYTRYHRKKGWIGRRAYRYAHNDIVQFLFEFGIVGCSLLLLSWGYWLFSLCFRASGNALAAFMLLCGMGLACGHAFVDFIFNSPAYWIAFNGLLCIAVKLLALHSERVRHH